MVGRRDYAWTTRDTAASRCPRQWFDHLDEPYWGGGVSLATSGNSKARTRQADGSELRPLPGKRGKLEADSFRWHAGHYELNNLSQLQRLALSQLAMI